MVPLASRHTKFEFWILVIGEERATVFYTYVLFFFFNVFMHAVDLKMEAKENKIAWFLAPENGSC